MRSWREKFQAMAMAVAFAEEGEWEVSKTFLKEPAARQPEKRPDSKKHAEKRVRKLSFRV